MSYSFRDREVAEELKRFANHNLGKTNTPRIPLGREVIIVKTPAGGIDASTTITESAECTIMYLDTSGDEPELVENTDVTMTVFNKESTPIGGSTIIYASRVGVHWMAVTGGGGAIRTMKSTSEITARSGDTAGTGTAVSYESLDGIVYTLGTEDPPYDIINPYAQTVSNGIVIQCRAAADGKWELIQAECEDTTTT